MGLDAVVYKNKRTFALNAEFADARIDEMTGEVYFEDSFPNRTYPRDTFVGVKKRLGNTAMITYLREEILRVVGDRAPTIQGKILYNGTHSGDVIPVSGLDELQNELALIAEMTRDGRSPELQAFMDDVKDLIATAKVECNPIVFT